MAEYSKQTISTRIRAEYAEKLRKMAEDQQTTISDVVEKVYDNYFNPTPTPQTVHDNVINLEKLKPTTFAMILEVVEKGNCTIEYAFESLMQYVIANCGEPEQKYVEQANTLING